MMGAEPSPPLVPADLDLSPLDGFMLDVVRLLGSELVALSTGDEFKAAVLLWARAWKQRPAASLPADERILASFAGYGRDLPGWRKVSDMAMRGFVMCSDGRWYHPVLAADAIRAGEAMTRRRERTKAATEARKKAAPPVPNHPPSAPPSPPRNDERNDNRNGQRDDNVTAHVTENVTTNVTTSHRRDGTGRDLKKEEGNPLTPLPSHPDLMAIWPRKDAGPDAVRREWDAATMQGAEPAEILAAAKGYLALPEVRDRDRTKLPSLANWLKDGGWRAAPVPPKSAPDPKATERLETVLWWSRKRLTAPAEPWPTVWGPPPTDAEHIAADQTIEAAMIRYRDQGQIDQELPVCDSARGKKPTVAEFEAAQARREARELTVPGFLQRGKVAAA